MTTPSTETTNAPLTRDLFYAARYYLLSRRGIVIMAAIAIVAGIAFNWTWLVATGIAPILLTALPCALMCGLGLCANRLFGSSCASQPSQSVAAEKETETLTTQRVASDDASSCCGESATAKIPADAGQTQSLDERRSPHA